MKQIRFAGLVLFVLAMSIFILSISIGSFQLTQDAITKSITEAKHLESLNPGLQQMVGQTFTSSTAFLEAYNKVLYEVNDAFKAKNDWDNVIWTDYTLELLKNSSIGFFVDNRFTFFLLSFIMGIVGALMYIIPKVKLDGHPGIKNNHIFHKAATSRGWIGIIVGTFLIGFYILLYFYPQYITNLILMVDPISMALKGKPASQWFLYGFLYCVAMSVMGIRMFIKYRHSKYQMVRTASVLFFQIALAFLLPEILLRLNQPYFDFKNIWPLNYGFFESYSLKTLLENSGAVGMFMLMWGIALVVIAVPVFVYFFGKRWYCSWVCGCGGLAETLGDPYRQLSDKSLTAWKIERWSIHSVLVFAIVMTAMTLYGYFSGSEYIGFEGTFFHFKVYSVYKAYGFLIGNIFSGVVGTGFYPLMGNRVWCRFGCPLAAYLGLVQRFKSRFRITTNGGQCISCGNCSTYCEMGIDVRYYAQRGQNIVRSSCVGCGVCSAVCPRGVLNLENADGTSMEERTAAPPIIIGRDKVEVADNEA